MLLLIVHYLYKIKSIIKLLSFLFLHTDILQILLLKSIHFWCSLDLSLWPKIFSFVFHYLVFFFRKIWIFWVFYLFLFGLRKLRSRRRLLFRLMVLLGLILGLGKHLSYWLIIFWGFDWNFVDWRTPGTFDKRTHAKSEANHWLTITTADYSIERIALVHVFARSANKDLSISRNKLDNCTKVASDFPYSYRNYIIGKLGFAFFLGLFSWTWFCTLLKGWTVLNEKKSTFFLWITVFKSHPLDMWFVPSVDNIPFLLSQERVTKLGESLVHGLVAGFIEVFHLYPLLTFYFLILLSLSSSRHYYYKDRM